MPKEGVCARQVVQYVSVQLHLRITEPGAGRTEFSCKFMQSTVIERENSEHLHDGSGKAVHGLTDPEVREISFCEGAHDLDVCAIWSQPR